MFFSEGFTNLTFGNNDRANIPEVLRSADIFQVSVL